LAKTITKAATIFIHSMAVLQILTIADKTTAISMAKTTAISMAKILPSATKTLNSATSFTKTPTTATKILSTPIISFNKTTHISKGNLSANTTAICTTGAKTTKLKEMAKISAALPIKTQAKTPIVHLPLKTNPAPTQTKTLKQKSRPKNLICIILTTAKFKKFKKTTIIP